MMAVPDIIAWTMRFGSSGKKLSVRDRPAIFPIRDEIVNRVMSRGR
jgi:hypothetical protein